MNSLMSGRIPLITSLKNIAESVMSLPWTYLNFPDFNAASLIAHPPANIS